MAMIARKRFRALPQALSVARSQSAGWLVRWLQEEASDGSDAFRPASINLLKAAPPISSFKGLELVYGDGQKLCFSAEFLRVKSLAADSTRRRADGQTKVISGRKHIHILGLELVGNYGIRIIYDDTHSTGIYTWDYLHELGCNKFYYMRQYIESLREHGLSRSPYASW